ncbi:putative zinc-binding dehydrogenase family oxidoreductase [Xylaria bambusicola]|uniref:putative zinc-binding dehydrogenase family oxidoreductase n=1 Tax=Xylaria bambusicola TaxID=326684 RepID=UPI002007B91E|nr:putative zinc-binding dehydrogenase family oxidoreductase [Xylaria bambusicola]KAI0515232.1 putative zinc-binding dehydrogenase family oxidoreductase [Xylaria bambusicola]
MEHHVHRAIVGGLKGQPMIVGDMPRPPLLPGMVIVKVSSVALNPVDYKTGEAMPAMGAVIGMDFAGAIVEIASDSKTSLKCGDHVCGLTHGSNPHVRDNGAFAEYVRADPSFLLKIPSSWVDNDEMARAATLGLALVSSAMALWGPECLNLTASPDRPVTARPDTDEWSSARLPVLVFGASTASGTIATQMLQLSGLDPIAACSPHNFDLVKSRGATAVFDRNQPADEITTAIRQHTKGQLRHVLDCIGNAETAAICYSAMSRTGGRYTSLNRVSDAVLNRRRAISASFFHAAEAFGRGINLPGYIERPADERKRELVAGKFKMYQTLLDEGKLQLHSTEILEVGGFEGVITGLERLKTGAISGKKLVVRIT